MKKSGDSQEGEQDNPGSNAEPQRRRDSSAGVPLWLHRLKRHPLVAVVVAAVAVIGAISTILTLMGQISALLSDSDTSQPPITFPAEQLERQLNARFGFSFQYPKTWSRHDPANQDGATFVDPTNPSVTIAGWGGHSLTSSFYEEVKSERSFVRERGGIIEEDLEAGLTIIDKEGRRIDVPGWRFRYVWEDPDTDTSMKTLQCFTRVDGRSVAIALTAPEDDYDRYSAAFDLLASELRLLTDCLECG